MQYEFILYIFTFILTMGITTIGILLSFTAMRMHNNNQLSFLLYQQIFLFSFFIYGIWGGIAVRVFLGDAGLSQEWMNKINFFFPILGMPFILVSWFMLMRTGFLIHGLRFPKTVSWLYFPVFIVLLTSLVVAVQTNFLPLPDSPEKLVIKILIILNFIPNTILILTTRSKQDKVIPLSGHWLALYAAGVIVYSFALIYHDVFGSISTCVAILLLFIFSTVLPAGIWYSGRLIKEREDLDFQGFCELFDISKREAEIILEICSGKSNQAIADELYITVQTVKDHNHRIYTKTGVKNRVQLRNLVLEKTGKSQLEQD